MKCLKNLVAPVAAAMAFVVFSALDAAAGTIYVPSGYPTIGNALAEANSGDTVEVDEGTYSVSETISIPAGVTVLAPKGPEKTEIKSTGTQDDVVLVDGADAKLVGFAVSDAKGKRAVHIVNGGVVSNCVVRNSTFTPSDERVAVLVESGTLVRSTVTNTVISGSAFSNIKGSAVRLVSGLVDSCFIAHNRGVNTYGSGVKNYFLGGAVYMQGGTLRNSLVADNYSQFNAMGVYMKSSATIDGCTIAGNYNLDSTDADSVGLSMTVAGTVVNTIVWGNENKNGVANVKKTSGTMTYSCTTPAVAGTGNTSDDPNFIDADAGDYRLGYGSAIDTAAPRDWHEGALDLDGESRVFGKGPDMGCYESHSTDLGCNFMVDEVVGAAPHKVTVRASCSAGVDGTTFKWYFTGGDEPDVTKTGDESAEWTYGTDALGVHDIRLVVENDGATGSKTLANAVTVGPAVCYVDAANPGESVPPYTSPAAAAKNISEAVACAVKGTVVSVREGTYPQTETITLAPGVTLVATDGPEKTTVVNVKTIADSTAGYTMIDVGTATFTGFTVTGGKNAYGVLVGAGGTVSNCVIRNMVWGKPGVSQNENAVCVQGGTLVRCTVTNNVMTGSSYCNDYQGAVRVSGSGVVDACIIRGNSYANAYAGNIKSFSHGAGGVWVEDGTLRNSLVAENFCSFYGTGVRLDKGTVDGCTIAGNYNRDSTDPDSVGLYMGNGTVINTIIWGNENKNGVANVKKASGTMTYSCTTPKVTGAGNTDESPNFVDAGTGNYRIGFGSALDTATPRGWHGTEAEGWAKDLDGEDRVFGEGPDMGCYEAHSTDLGCDIALEGAEGDKIVGPTPLRVTVTGSCSAGTEGTTFKWYFTGGDEPDVEKTDVATAEWTYTGLGVSDIRLVVENGGATGSKTLTGAVTVGPAVCFVDAANAGHSVAPYTSPETAAANIADAVSVAVHGTEIRVAAGTYMLAEPIVVDKRVRILGAGTDRTIVQSANGSSQMSVSLANDGALFANFFVRNSSHLAVNGGTVSNCVIAGCAGTHRGGGAQITRSGRLFGCTITNNTVSSGNVWAAGGGVYATGENDAVADRDAVLVENCVIAGNVSGPGGVAEVNRGGGGVLMHGGTIRNSLIAGNTAAYGPGGANLQNTLMVNCTVVSNLTSASGSTYASVGGVCARGSAGIVNSIVYGNCVGTWDAIVNFIAAAGSSATVSHSLVGEPGDEEPFAGEGNVLYQDPLFKNAARGNYRLQSRSPCVGKGDASVYPDVEKAKDLDGRSRLFNRTLDLGCYENHSGGLVLQVW